MNGTPRTDELDIRKRRALFRSWHRGMRECDLILGAFADARLAALTQEELEQYEDLLQAPDTELFKWMTGEQPVPERYDTTLFRSIQEFRQSAD